MGSKRDIEASETFPHLGECGANGNIVVLVFFPTTVVADGPIRGVASKISPLV